GHAGVCLATLGPGATNLATGVADANLDRAPVVAITGQLARHLLHKESHQYVDIVDVFRPFTKWNARIETGAVVAEAVRKAFKRGHASKALTSLAGRAPIPVVTTFMAKGAIAVAHRLARTTVGLASDAPARVGFTSADVVIAVGYDPVEYSAAQWNPSGRLRI